MKIEKSGIFAVWIIAICLLASSITSFRDLLLKQYEQNEILKSTNQGNK